jgi:hypothetical protein
MVVDFKKINATKEAEEKDVGPMVGDRILMVNKDEMRADVLLGIMQPEESYMMEAIVIEITNRTLKKSIPIGWVQFISGHKKRTYFNNNFSYMPDLTKKKSPY